VTTQTETTLADAVADIEAYIKGASDRFVLDATAASSALTIITRALAETDDLRQQVAMYQAERDAAIARADRAEKRRQYESIDAYNQRINAALHSMRGVEG
jgi:hypothetical protein